MIHAFALEPQLVATWGRREEFRFIQDKFGLGTARILFEIPSFTNWKRAVYKAAKDLNLSAEEMKRIEELFRIFSEHKCRRNDSAYDGLVAWLENVEQEYERKRFAGIIASANPRNHEGVLVMDQLSASTPQWRCDTGASPERTPEAIAAALSAMLLNCKQIHLVDPYFGPENARHRKILEALLNTLSEGGVLPEKICVHCTVKSELLFFEKAAAKMADRIPKGMRIEFVRWGQRSSGEKLHNRYVLTDIGGVSLGVGLDEGAQGETDDLLLLPRAQYEKRWAQYAGENNTFEEKDRPRAIEGSRKTG